jgi:NADPH-dependent 2,4-dienoyl-CoA reductase/sulfur reductase-like enzyme
VGRDLLELEPLKSPLKVVVVGGGPAGLSAAAAAAQRGARVTLLEKKGVPGGMLNIAKIPPHKEPLGELIEHLVDRAVACGVEICTGHAADAVEVQSFEPDRVIVATGSTSVTLRVSGLEGNERVVLCEDLLEAERIVKGAGYIVVGGGAAGLEAAEYIAEEGGQVTVIEMTEHLGTGLHATRLHLTFERLAKSNVRVMPNTKLQSVEGGLVRAETPEGLVTLGPFDWIVMAVGYRSETTLAGDLDPALSSRIVGDALKPRSIYEAITEGFDAALNLEA